MYKLYYVNIANYYIGYSVSLETFWLKVVPSILTVAYVCAMHYLCTCTSPCLRVNIVRTKEEEDHNIS